MNESFPKTPKQETKEAEASHIENNGGWKKPDLEAESERAPHHGLSPMERDAMDTRQAEETLEVIDAKIKNLEERAQSMGQPVDTKQLGDLLNERKRAAATIRDASNRM